MREDNRSLSVELDAEITPYELSEYIGDQWIIEGRGKPFSYLAGLALETMDDGGYDIVDVLVEFLYNEGTLDLSREDVEEIEEILDRGR